MQIAEDEGADEILHPRKARVQDDSFGVRGLVGQV